jgi:hypothetical protein
MVGAGRSAQAGAGSTAETLKASGRWLRAREMQRERAEGVELVNWARSGGEGRALAKKADIPFSLHGCAARQLRGAALHLSLADARSITDNYRRGRARTAS